MPTERELKKIPIAPRAKMNRPLTRSIRVQVAKDDALIAIAKRVVAGIDKRHELFPDYKRYVRDYGKKRFHRLVESMVKSAGACDVIQTDMEHSGLGLFGGLAANRTRFIFFEWIGGKYGQLRVSMTGDEARDIVSGKKKTIWFKPVRHRIRYLIEPQAYEIEDTREKWRRRHVYVRDASSWSFPEKNNFADPNEMVTVNIAGKKFTLEVQSCIRQNLGSKRCVITLIIPDLLRKEIGLRLRRDGSWKRRTRGTYMM